MTMNSYFVCIAATGPDITGAPSLSQFLKLKGQGAVLLPAWWDVNTLQGYPLVERQTVRVSSMPRSRSGSNGPRQALNSDCSIWSPPCQQLSSYISRQSLHEKKPVFKTHKL